MATKKKTNDAPAAAPAKAKKAAKKTTKKKAAKKAAKPAKAAKAKAAKPAKAAKAKAAKPAKKAKAKKAAKPKAARAKKAAAPAPAPEGGEGDAQPASSKGAKASGAPAPRVAPEVGAPAPDFDLACDDGSNVSLASLAGKNVVLYFYPRDATPGCTIEACGFRDAYAEIEAKGAVVLGVSRDSVASHAKFKKAQNLPFRLLSDPTGEMIASYGSWGEKTFMGRKSMGILRTTVLIDPSGKIHKIYPKVSPKEHAAQVLADLAALQAS